MKGRDVVKWLKLNKDYSIPVATFLFGVFLGWLWA